MHESIDHLDAPIDKELTEAFDLIDAENDRTDSGMLVRVYVPRKATPRPGHREMPTD